MSRAICARRRRSSASAAFLHADLFPGAIAPAWAAPGKLAEPHEAVPIELLGATARAAHVLDVTARNLVQGAIFGGIFGLISGAWGKRSLSGAFAEARSNGRSWGAISAVYAGLQAASLVIRRKDDRINSVVGACGSGAAFSARGGPTAALQGCVSFAAISYLIEAVATPKEESPATNDAAILNKK